MHGGRKSLLLRYSFVMERIRSAIAFGIAAWLLLALAIGLVAFSFGDHDTTWTPQPTKAVFDWLYSVPEVYRLLAAAVLGGCGVAMGVAAKRRA